MNRVGELQRRLGPIALVLALALLVSGCAADAPRAGNDTTTTIDCVAAGTCPEGPDTTEAAATTGTTGATGDTYLGFPVGFTEDGYPRLGDPDAPVSLVEFSDYLCPFCGRHFNETTPQLLEQ